MGGGWFADEHRAFGLEEEFGSGFGERLDRLAEAVPLVRRLLDGERVTHEGRFYRLRDALAAPRPVQARIPCDRRLRADETLPLVARHADSGTPSARRGAWRLGRHPPRALPGHRPGPGRDRAHGQ